MQTKDGGSFRYKEKNAPSKVVCHITRAQFTRNRMANDYNKRKRRNMVSNQTTYAESDFET